MIVFPPPDALTLFLLSEKLLKDTRQAAKQKAKGERMAPSDIKSAKVLSVRSRQIRFAGLWMNRQQLREPVQLLS